MKRTGKLLSAIVSISIFFGFLQNAYAEVSVVIDRSSVAMGESLMLQLKVSGSATADKPDLAPLEKDFVVIGTNQSSQIQISNGKRESSITWQIGLEPKRAGQLVIPSLNVNGEKTRQISLRVLPESSQSSQAGGKDFMVELLVEPKTAYVQQQLSVIVRLYSAASLTEGALDEPSGENLLVEKLGEDVNYQKTIGSQQYRIIERRYAVTPQHSGELEIQPIRFQGRTANNNYNSFFDRGKRVSARSKGISFTVKPRPEEYPKTADWLPARQLTITEAWPDGLTRITAGVPTTWELSIHAEGLSPSQIPDINSPEGTGYRIYPDQPESSAKVKGQWIVGEKTLKFAIIPDKAGELQLPAIRIPWWNTQTNKLEWAELPTRKIPVRPGTQIATTQTEPQLQSEFPDNKPRENPPQQTPVSQTQPFYLSSWLIPLFAALWIITLILWYIDRNSNKKHTVAQTTNPTSYPGSDINTLCQCKTPLEMTQRILQWSRHIYSSAPVGLIELAQRIDDAKTSSLLLALHQSAFSANADAFKDCKELKKQLLVAAKKPTKDIKKTRDVLPELYPS